MKSIKQLKQEHRAQKFQSTLNQIQGKSFSIYETTNYVFIKYGFWICALIAGSVLFIYATTP